jgi:hypothetical protein
VALEDAIPTSANAFLDDVEPACGSGCVSVQLIERRRLSIGVK